MISLIFDSKYYWLKGNKFEIIKIKIFIYNNKESFFLKLLLMLMINCSIYVNNIFFGLGFVF